MPNLSVVGEKETNGQWSLGEIDCILNFILNCESVDELNEEKYSFVFSFAKRKSRIRIY